MDGPCCPSCEPAPQPVSVRARSRAGLGISLLAAAGLLSPVWHAAGAEERPAREDRRAQEERRLEKIQQDIEEIRERLLRTEAKTGSVLDAIEELDLKVALVGRESEALRRELREMERQEAATRQEALVLERGLAAREDDMRGWLREVYKAGPTRYLRLVAASSSPAKIAAGYRAVEALTLGEARLIEQFRADRQRLDVVVLDLAGQREALLQVGADLERKNQDHRDSRLRKEAVLAGLKQERSSQRKILLELVQVEQDVRALLSKLAQPGTEEVQTSLGFARFRGLLEWPAHGKLAIPFGNLRHPRFNTEVPHPGIDIAAAPGQEVRAVFDGRVVFSSWFKGYGQMVVLDHGDGYLSIYGHVDQRLAEPGRQVRQGEVIARAGDAGSFDVPGVYFEIRHDGKPEDPARWLRASPERAAESRPPRREMRGSRRAP
jgi:murein hydrolase activator